MQAMKDEMEKLQVQAAEALKPKYSVALQGTQPRGLPKRPCKGIEVRDLIYDC